MPRGNASAPKKVVRGPKGHKLAEEFPAGTVLQDLCKKQWQLSSVIGQGGFGLIYLASDEIEKKPGQAVHNYVVKIEPKDNGPLFCEMQFYQRVAKPNLFQSFITSRKLRYLGVPPYIATGRQIFNTKEFRFLVMPRLGTVLQKYLLDCGGFLPPKTVFGVGLRILDALEFLHEHEYVHADVKADNILTGYRGGSAVPNEVYLVDYGLAYRYIVDGVHKEYKEDPRKAHDGTIEFTSRDAHRGVSPSRRADLEILGYCMLRWLCGRLPWEDKLTDPRYVAESKERLTGDPEKLVAACLPGPKIPSLDCLCKYMGKVNNLKYDSKPDYKSFRELMRGAATKAGLKDEWKLELDSIVGEIGGKKASKRKSDVDTPDGGKAKKASPAKRPKTAPAKARNSTPVKPSSSSKLKTSPIKAKVSPKKKAPAKSPVTKASPIRTKKSPLPPSPLARAVNGAAKRGGPGGKKVFQMPPPTKPAAEKGSTSAKKATIRRVRRVAAVQSDMSVQTSPGLLNNR